MLKFSVILGFDLMETKIVIFISFSRCFILVNHLKIDS